MSGQYDFREGILLEKVVYKDDSFDIKSRILYILCILLTWCWGLAWFSLFFWAYIFHEQVAFWVFIIVWLIHFIIVVVVGALTLMSARNKKLEKKRKKEEFEMQQKRIEENRRKRAHALKQEELNQNEDNDSKGIPYIQHEGSEINTGEGKNQFNNAVNDNDDFIADEPKNTEQEPLKNSN